MTPAQMKIQNDHRRLLLALVDDLRKNGKIDQEIADFIRDRKGAQSECPSQQTKKMFNSPGLLSYREREMAKYAKNSDEGRSSGRRSAYEVELVLPTAGTESEMIAPRGSEVESHYNLI